MRASGRVKKHPRGGKRAYKATSVDAYPSLIYPYIQLTNRIGFVTDSRYTPSELGPYKTTYVAARL